MTRAKLFAEGARLPEELSRLLFLEPVIAGRRVLEVGARSGAVARFLLELGAARVVCAAEDRDLIQALRAENLAWSSGRERSGPPGPPGAAAAERTDFRVIRPGMLPGDDGAFDLVIDFGLPAALAAGSDFRLTDIARLLSPDGFAVTSLQNGATPSLSALFGEAGEPLPIVGRQAAAGLGREAGPVTYRGLVDALRLQFELVQVYFQSLMLGYFFGSYDIDPKDDGVAPQTALMGSDPEPAGHYMFAFGNAVPVIEDVTLVQVPFAELIAARGRLGVLPAATAGSAGTAASGGPATAALDALARPADHAPAAPVPAAVTVAPVAAAGDADVARLTDALEQRTAERDGLLARVQDLDATVASREASVVALRGEVATARARLHELEHTPHDADGLAAVAAHVHDDNAVLREERAQLLVQVSRLEEALVDTEVRSRAVEDICARALGRVDELQAEIRRLELERLELPEELQPQPPPAVPPPAVPPPAVPPPAVPPPAVPPPAVSELGAPADDAPRDASPPGSFAAAEQDFASNVIDDLRAQLTVYEGELSAAADALIQERRRHDALFGEVERLRAIALQAEVDGPVTAPGQACAELAAVTKRRDELEADALRLAEAVKKLVDEREQTRVRGDVAQEHVEALAAELARAHEENERAMARVAALESHGEDREARLKAAQAGRDDARRDAEAARADLREVADQRETLKQVLAARDRELATLKEELRSATGETQRLTAQAEAQHKALVEARQRLSALEVERAQLRRREEELGRQVLENADRIAGLEGRLRETPPASEVDPTLSAALDAALARVALLEGSLDEARSGLETYKARGDLLQAHLDEARTRLGAEVTRAELLAAQLEEAQIEAVSRIRTRSPLE